MTERMIRLAALGRRGHRPSLWQRPASGVQFIACSCGWRGKNRVALGKAADDFKAHLATTPGESVRDATSRVTADASIDFVADVRGDDFAGGAAEATEEPSDA